MAKKPSAELLDIGATFGTWAGLGETASIGISIASAHEIGSPEQITELNRIMWFLCGARIDVNIKVGKEVEDDMVGQIEFDMMTSSVITATADSKSIGCRPGSYTGKLSFKTADLNLANLHLLVKQPGRIMAKRLGVAGGDKTEGSEDGGLHPDNEG